MRKRRTIMIAMLAAGVMLTACQSKEPVAPAQTEISTEQQERSTAEPAAAAQESIAAETLVPAQESIAAETQEQTAPADTQAAVSDTELADLWGMLGMNDAETAGLFGGGEENWTQDKSFYIGRIYQIELLGETYPMYTSCNDEKNVNAVSVWLANGEREVTKEEAEQWAARLTEASGAEPTYNETESEAGSKNWKWFFDGKSVTLNWMDKILSINMNLAVGEMR